MYSTASKDLLGFAQEQELKKANRGPCLTTSFLIQLPAKAVAMASDLKRNVAFFDVPILDTPNNFFSSAAREILQCQRLIVAAQLHKLDADAVSRLVDSCTTSVHLDAKCRTEDNDLHAIDDKFLAACCKRAGLDDAVAKVLLDLRGSAEVKAQLQSNTERAVEAGAYGSPTMIFHSPTPNATGESDIMIFGSDRFEQAAFLIGKPWYGPRGPPSSAKL